MNAPSFLLNPRGKPKDGATPELIGGPCDGDKAPWWWIEHRWWLLSGGYYELDGSANPWVFRWQVSE